MDSNSKEYKSEKRKESDDRKKASGYARVSLWVKKASKRKLMEIAKVLNND